MPDICDLAVKEILRAVLARVLCQRDRILERIEDSALRGEHGKFSNNRGNQLVKPLFINKLQPGRAVFLPLRQRAL